MSLVWEGVVLEVWKDGDTFTVRLCREGHPDLEADFSMRECGVSVVPGDLLIIKKNSVVKRDLGVWTQEEVDDIRRRATLLAAKLGFLAG